MSFAGEVPAEITRELSVGERVLWSGQPRRGISLVAADLGLIPFSLMWGGFAFYWEWSVLHSGAPAFFAIWGIPFVAIGVYMIIGRFFVDAWHRSRIFYAVTNERVLIVDTLFSTVVKSLSLRTLSEMTLTDHSEGTGTILFGNSTIPAAVRSFSAWPTMKRRMGPQFERIPDARQVRELILRAQNSSTR